MLIVNDREASEVTENDPGKLRLMNELRLAKAQYVALELEILNARDHSIGQAAELATARHGLGAVRHELVTVRHELAAVRSSTTWKIGRFFMLPIRVLRRVGRR